MQDGQDFVHPDRRSVPALAAAVADVDSVKDEGGYRRAGSRRSPPRETRRPSQSYGDRDDYRYRRDRRRQSPSPARSHSRTRDYARSRSPSRRSPRRSLSPRPAQASRARRRPVPEDAQEKTRGKRLFGSLLGTLGSAQRQLSSTAQQARLAQQQEIQQRQQQRLQEEADLQKQQAQEAHAYRAQQASLEADYAKRRRLAYYLYTETEPVLRYLPKMLSDEQQEIIAKQVDQVEQERADALSAFELRWQAQHILSPQLQAKEAPSAVDVPLQVPKADL
ncbi:hypothetical protein BCR37DRAFT_250936 [Protomyces lactucae-debilis]|uniref:Pinin/SDK/MemA protein domain-containing protein n=1 Tax=Protomyces lactucae-debilis TaxID=2754530 RepID=A0A1Y2FPY7_PROLT|nr:uncharacterized protein BCR37DRAFT_250936 [Protomyces lactucae-debilis]ORY84775.1 hypothetical protein BCR37DRAFT_250936 [Protomyces lactucae-debilis]